MSDQDLDCGDPEGLVPPKSSSAPKNNTGPLSQTKTADDHTEGPNEYDDV